jgi:hypothetical protein
MSFQSIQYTPVSRKSIKVKARNPEGLDSRLLTLCERTSARIFRSTGAEKREG